MTALTPNIKSRRRSYRASLDDMSLLDSDMDDLDPGVARLIDALARAQAADDHRRETEASNDH